MKNNKLLYLLIIFITLFTFNINVNADETKAPRFLVCAYKRTEGEDGIKIALQQIDGEITIFTHNSNVAVTQPGWKKLDFHNYEDYGVERDINGRLKSCPTAITISVKQFMNGNCNHSNPLASAGCEIEEKKIIEYYASYGVTYKDEEGNNKSGKQELETVLQDGTRVNIQSADNNDDPGDAGAPGNSTVLDNPDKVNTETTGKTCKAAVEDYKNSEDGRCDTNNGCYAACYYGKYIETEGCHIVSIKFPTANDIKVNAIDPSYNTNIYYKNNSFDFSPLRKTVIDNEGWCLKRIGVYRSGSTQSYISESITDLYNPYYRVSEEGYNLVDNTKLQSNNPDKENRNTFGDLNFLDYSSCESIFDDEASKKLLEMIKLILKLIKIAIPILLIGLGVADFAKAVFAGKEDEMKKAQGKFIKRIIIAICIFLVPTLLQFILNIANSIWGNISVDLCGILD